MNNTFFFCFIVFEKPLGKVNKVCMYVCMYVSLGAKYEFQYIEHDLL